MVVGTSFKIFTKFGKCYDISFIEIEINPQLISFFTQTNLNKSSPLLPFCLRMVTDHPDVLGDSTKAIIKPYSNFAPHHLQSNGVRADANHGAPATASDTYFANQYMSVGTETCTPGSFPVSERTSTEAFHVLEGVFFVTNTDGSARRCVAGDTVVLPKGWSGQWDVIETVKKVWVNSFV